ncbi:hypothetical protein [Rhodobaculum claviforme]|nr:hypothetical protein [Rhodobaculum claviforme]
MIGRYSSVHGQYVSSRPDGRVVVRVGPSLHVGRPVSAVPAPGPASGSAMPTAALSAAPGAA